MTRMPFGRTLFRYSSVTRWIARVGVLQLFLVGQRGLVAERHLAAEPHLAVAVDLDHLDQHVVALGEDVVDGADPRVGDLGDVEQPLGVGDRKSTRLNSSHGYISYAVFCLKKKKKNDNVQCERHGLCKYRTQ